MPFEKKPEILAPAGTLEALTAVLDAGADAVYLGAKRFNMRLHRSSYNLRDDEVAAAVSLAHKRGKKIYITLNNLVLDCDLAEVRDLLSALGEVRPDAIIVQDLAVAALARELCVHVPLHASTMMNVHSAETALALKLMGFKRVITSRDIPLHEVRRIGEVSGLEMEYFVHGDMCIAQGGQCLASGILFGESSNRGRCMKPCRWKWDLVTVDGNFQLEGMTHEYLLGRKDLCLFQHIPALVQNGIVSLKIEGRMRTPEFLAPVVAAYREAVDAYCADPLHYAANANAMHKLWAKRVRDFTTSHAFCNPGAPSVDPTGAREPRFFSHASPAMPLTVDADEPPRAPKGDFELVVHVAGIEAAEAAVEAGANAVYLGGDGHLRGRAHMDVEQLRGFVERMAEQDVRVAYLGSRIADERDMAEWRTWLREIRGIHPLAVGVSNLGSLHAAREMRMRDILADFSLNVCNSVAADELSTVFLPIGRQGRQALMPAMPACRSAKTLMGATRVTASLELNFEELSKLIAASRLPVEIIGQGPLPGLLLEHCVISAATGDIPQGACPMNCRRSSFALRDATDREFRIETDRRCRSHIYLPCDVCALPNLSRIAATGAAGLRIEAQFEEPGAVAVIVAAYRLAIDSLRAGRPVAAAAGVARICEVTGRRQSDGPFAFHLFPVRTKEDSGVVQSAHRS